MTVLQLLIGTNSLRNRIKRQSALLNADREYAAAQKNLLRESIRNSTTSPLGLAATAAAGFAFERTLLRPRRKKIILVAPDEAHEPAPRSLWWELLMPVIISWARDAIVTQLHRMSEKKAPQN